MGITAGKVSAIIVTRGDVSLDDVLASLEGMDETIVWDNSKRPQDLKVFGRYEAIKEARNDVIYVQDDDAVIPWEDILPHYAPGRLLANMDRDRWGPNWGYPDSTLVGWGAVFDRDLPGRAFETFRQAGNDLSSEVFLRTCDVVFSSLTARTVGDWGYRHLPWAAGPGRMWTGDPHHSQERNAILEKCRKIRGSQDDDVRLP